MPHYRYRARDLHGSSVSGVMEASDTKDLEKKLSERRVYLIEAKEERAGLLSKQISIPFLRKVRPTHLILFTRQLSAMLKAGVPITQALGTLSEQTESFTLKEAIKKIRENIERGSNFADALAHHPTIFSELYVSTVRVGEETGNIEEVLDSISNFLEREMDIKSKVKGALLYPIVLLVVASGLIVFLVSYVLPKFRAVFYTANVPLPLPTHLMFKISELFQKYWYVLLLIIFFIVLGVHLTYRSKKGRYFIDRLKLKLFLFGPLVRKVGISRFARSLEILVRSGVDLGRSFQVIKGSIGNVVLEEVMDKVRENVMRGGSINEPLRRSDEFPPMVAHMISIGEETGNMEDMLKEVCVSYDKEVDFTIKIFTSILEPLLLVVMGGIVLFIALSLYLPLFKMAKIIQYY